MPQPFHLRVPDSELVDLRERLARTRFPDSAPGDPWVYGTSVDYLRRFIEYWCSQLRLARAGGAAERLPAVQGGALPDYDLHFLHVPGKGPNPTAHCC